MHNPVIWFEIYVQNLARARKFYQDVFQVKLEKLDSPDASIEMWSFPMDQNSVGAMGALVKMEGVAPGGGGTLVYFSCKDCAVEAARVGPAGGTVFKEKFSIGQYGAIALVTDSEGNMIGLHSMQ